MPHMYFAFSLLAVAFVAPASAQNHHPGVGHSANPAASSLSPYAGLESRTVKALSDQQVADLQAGRGMTLALAAELNGYPGPSHVLELADALRLSADQKMRTAALLSAMKSETTAIGTEVVAGETELDRLFANRIVTGESMEAQVARISAAQGRLRVAHLRYHLTMMEILSPDQGVAYARLRGYSTESPDPKR